MRSPSLLRLALGLSLALAACKKDPGGGSAGSGVASGSAGSGAASGSAAGSGKGSATGPATVNVPDIDSKDILARTTTAPEVQVKHVLLAWKELAPVYGGHLDPRAAKRTAEEAAAQAKDILAKLQANPGDIDALVKQYSEDPGGAGDPYAVSPGSGMVPEFEKMSLRLNEKEAGIVKTQFGYHVIERVPPPPLDPLASADILARPAVPGQVSVQHVLIGWKDVPAASRGLDPRAANRTKAEADTIAKDVLAKVQAGGDMAALMKQYSEDPGSKDSARAYDVSADAPMVDSFKKLSLRLKPGEAGMVISPFGWHIIRRVPPDALESADILAREPVTEKAKVKHVLLGWTEVHADDPRGVKRTRKELETLVATTVAKLQKGAAIEPVMKELSEDPGSAATGISYDVDPKAGLVEPFKQLSLRLKVGEVGVVKTSFGIHIIKRVE